MRKGRERCKNEIKWKLYSAKIVTLAIVKIRVGFGRVEDVEIDKNIMYFDRKLQMQGALPLLL